MVRACEKKTRRFPRLAIEGIRRSRGRPKKSCGEVIRPRHGTPRAYQRYNLRWKDMEVED